MWLGAVLASDMLDLACIAAHLGCRRWHAMVILGANEGYAVVLQVAAAVLETVPIAISQDD